MQKTAKQKLEKARVAGTSPSLPLEAYAGTYENDMYGDLRLDVEQGRLVLRRHSAWVGDVEHWHYDTFQVRWRDRVMGKNLVTFRLSAEGKASQLEVEELGTFDHKAGEKP